MPAHDGGFRLDGQPDRPDRPEEREDPEINVDLPDGHLDNGWTLAEETPGGVPPPAGPIDDVVHPVFHEVQAPPSGDLKPGKTLPEKGVDDGEQLPLSEQLSDAGTMFVRGTLEAFSLELIEVFAAAHGAGLLIKAFEDSLRVVRLLEALDSTDGLQVEIPIPAGPVDLEVSMRVEGDAEEETWPVSWFMSPGGGDWMWSVDIGPVERHRPSSGTSNDAVPELPDNEVHPLLRRRARGSDASPFAQDGIAFFPVSLNFSMECSFGETSAVLRAYALDLLRRHRSDAEFSDIDLIVLYDPDSREHAVIRVGDDRDLAGWPEMNAPGWSGTVRQYRRQPPERQ